MMAILFRVNLPLSVVVVWVSNPLTWLPLYGAGYLLGAKILGREIVSFNEMTMSWLMSQVIPLWLGSLILGSLLSLTGYLATRALWRLHIVRSWEKRRKCRRAAKDDCECE